MVSSGGVGVLLHLLLAPSEAVQAAAAELLDVVTRTCCAWIARRGRLGVTLSRCMCAADASVAAAGAGGAVILVGLLRTAPDAVREHALRTLYAMAGTSESRAKLPTCADSKRV